MKEYLENGDKNDKQRMLHLFTPEDETTEEYVTEEKDELSIDTSKDETITNNDENVTGIANQSIIVIQNVSPSVPQTLISEERIDDEKTARNREQILTRTEQERTQVKQE